MNEPDVNERPVRSLQLVSSFPLQIPEPSGLSLDFDGQALWTVSDRSNRVIKIDLQGHILKTLSYQGHDLEGITVDTVRHTLWIVEEHTREVVELDTTGRELERHRILSGNDNSGLEGICIDAEHRFFVVKEKKPGLFIALNSDFTIKSKREISFAGDFSGMCADTLLNRFWILSDQDESLFYWDRQKGVLSRYSLDVTKPEGIAVDFNKGLAYVVSDARSVLYVFRLQNSD